MNLRLLSRETSNYVRFLHQCIANKALSEGLLLHTHIIKTDNESQILLLNNLVTMYSKCQNIQSARKVFDRMPVRDAVSWNAIIAGYSQCGLWDEALNHFVQMQGAEVFPTQFTFASVIRACAGLGIHDHGEQLHCYVIKTGFEHDVYAGSALVDMYAKFRRIEDACQVFDQMPLRDRVAFNTLIAGYAQNGNCEEVLKVFEEMKWIGMDPDRITLTNMVDILPLHQGRQVHVHIIKTGFESNMFVGTSLIGMYAKCHCIDDARNVFDEMTECNLFPSTAMITGYAQAGYGWEALQVFNQMREEDVMPDPIAYASVFSACASAEFLKAGKQLHSLLIKSGHHSDVSVGSALVSMYGKCRSIDCAWQVFDEMSHRQYSILWTAMLSGFVHNGHCEKALNFFYQMQQTGLKPDNVTIISVLAALIDIPAVEQGKQIHGYIVKTGFEQDVSVGTGLLTMYANYRSIHDAHKVFNKMSFQDFVSWSAMIAGYAQQGHEEEALKLFCRCRRVGMKTNQFVFSSVLMACASLAALQQGKTIHGLILKLGLLVDVFVGSALVDMYAKCGTIECAKEVFDKADKVDIILWNSIIAGYCHHGHGSEALKLFEQMQEKGMEPDHVTFIAVLSACSHAGLVDDGRSYFDYMSSKYGINPRMEHYACMVDLLGRAGLLNEALKFMKAIPFEPGSLILRSLLSACRIRCNIELGKHIAEWLLRIEPQDTTTYVLLSNLYAISGDWDKAVKVRKLMEDRGLVKNPGTSWIEVTNKVHVFVAGDVSHPPRE